MLYKYSYLLIDERRINVGLMTKTWSAHVLVKDFFCKQTTHSAQPFSISKYYQHPFAPKYSEFLHQFNLFLPCCRSALGKTFVTVALREEHAHTQPTPRQTGGTLKLQAPRQGTCSSFDRTAGTEQAPLP